MQRHRLHVGDNREGRHPNPQPQERGADKGVPAMDRPPRKGAQPRAPADVSRQLSRDHRARTRQGRRDMERPVAALRVRLFELHDQPATRKGRDPSDRPCFLQRQKDTR